MATMQIDFAQAMSDFQKMFPDMESEVIEFVLRANQGAVDSTIDQLLAMSTDNQNEKLRNELDKTTITAKSESPRKTSLNASPLPIIGSNSDKGKSSLLNTPPPTQQYSTFNTGASPKVKKNISGVSSNTNSSSPIRGETVKLKWDPPLLGPLPATFLRITLPEGRSETDLLPDEQFAMMLQNEEFMHELRWNQEFMSSLEQDKERPDDDAAFKERLRYMGKKSRKKFMQLARVFTWQRNKKPNSEKKHETTLLQEEYYDGDIEESKHMKK